ncbi:MAG: DUF3237 domain-containing protein [Steroidobacteraceae bacterium]
MFEVQARVDKPLVLGQTSYGLRRVIPILGGTVEGPRLSGTLLEGGADWQYVRADGVLSLEARYTIRANDGTLISVTNRGLRHGPPEIIDRITRGEPVAPGSYYFRTVAEFEAPVGVFDWLNKGLFVGLAERRPDAAVVRFHLLK